MTTVEVEVDVPESRQVTVALPPGVPTGRVRLRVTVEPCEPAEAYFIRPSDPTVAVEFDAFLRIRPNLVSAYPGYYVAVHGGRVLAIDAFLDTVYRQARAAVGDAAVYYGRLVHPGAEVCNSGQLRILDSEPVSG